MIMFNLEVRNKIVLDKYCNSREQYLSSTILFLTSKYLRIATHFNDLKILVQEKFVLFKLTVI
jgi:hypothetical protein